VRSECPISCALDLLGDSWTLVVLRDLVLGNKRAFTNLATGEGIATNILSDRLNRLEKHGLIERRKDPNDRRRRLIEPTEKAWALVPLLLELAIYGQDHCGGQAEESVIEAARTDRESLIKSIRDGSLPA